MPLHRQLLLAFLLLGGVALAEAWQGPAQTPPAGNVAAPVNVSAAAQSKQGTLGVGGLGVFGRALVAPTAGYSLPANLQLGVNGAVGASQYCDQNGQNCVTTLGGAAVGGSATGAAAASGDRIVCGGWDTKYGAGLVAGSAWGCASPASAPACPAGYDTISSSHATINLAEHTNLCVLARAGSSRWEEVSLSDAASFDKACEYRFELTVSSGSYGENPFYYANAVDPVSITYISHASQVSHISADSKTVYRVNGAPVYTVRKIQKRCSL